MNGFKIGLSIPLWENRNTVKQAKAQAEYTVTNILANQQTLKATLRELYLQAEALANSGMNMQRLFPANGPTNYSIRLSKPGRYP